MTLHFPQHTSMLLCETEWHVLQNLTYIAMYYFFIINPNNNIRHYWPNFRAHGADDAACGVLVIGLIVAVVIH